MTATDLITFQRKMGYNNKQAAEALGIAPNTITAYLTSRRPIPRSIALAAAALYAGLKPFGDQK